MSEHTTSQELPWPPHPESPFNVSRFRCTCGWEGVTFRDTREEQDLRARERARGHAAEHVRTAGSDPVADALPRTAVGMIAAERIRQVEVEGYTPEHDAGHAEQIACAAMSYTAAMILTVTVNEQDPTVDAETIAQRTRENPPPRWPWSSHHWKPTGDPVRDLVKAGALIAAAIDSLLAEQGR